MFFWSFLAFFYNPIDVKKKKLDIQFRGQISLNSSFMWFKTENYNPLDRRWQELLVKNPPANVGDARDAGSVPELRRSSGVGNGSPLQKFCLKNSMDRGGWQTTDHGVAKSWTQLSACTHMHTTHTHTHTHTHTLLLLNSYCPFSVA